MSTEKEIQYSPDTERGKQPQPLPGERWPTSPEVPPMPGKEIPDMPAKPTEPPAPQAILVEKPPAK